MMSKIKSKKIAISKIILGMAVAVALVVAFACEQKESVENVPVVESSVKMNLSMLEEGKIEINGTAEDVAKLKVMFNENSGFEFITDSLGNIFLTKKTVIVPKTLGSDEQVFFIVEDMPEFPGGELALRKYIGNSIKYPALAQEKGIQGKVYVTFVVAKDGTIADSKIARGVDPTLDMEALRVVNELPKWKPGKQRGKTVNVGYTVPINFVLQ